MKMSIPHSTSSLRKLIAQNYQLNYQLGLVELLIGKSNMARASSIMVLGYESQPQRALDAGVNALERGFENKVQF